MLEKDYSHHFWSEKAWVTTEASGSTSFGLGAVFMANKNRKLLS